MESFEPLTLFFREEVNALFTFSFWPHSFPIETIAQALRYPLRLLTLPCLLISSFQEGTDRQRPIALNLAAQCLLYAIVK